MIVTLTANPSTDRTVELGAPLKVGGVQRSSRTDSQPAGKGVNVARVVAAAGQLSVAVLPARHEDPFVAALREEGVVHRAIPFDGTVRVNLTIADPDGLTTKINEPGDTLSVEVREAIKQALLREAAGARWAVLAGSLPPGVPDDWYCDLIAALRTTAARVAVDTSNAPLIAAASGAALPHLLKPNGEELGQLAGVEGDLEEDLDAAVVAAKALVGKGVETVLATLGAKGGLLANADGVWHATTPKVVPKSTVGAGDSTLSGYLVADLTGAGPEDRLRTAVAYGTAAVQLPGSTLPTPADVREDQVTVQRLA